MATLTKKAEQSEATRQALMKVARRLFTRHGYADASIEEIVQRAKVTRGALYHHFEDKRDLFRAVYEEVEQEMVEKCATALASEPLQERHLEAGVNAFLDGCMDPGFQRIVLLDGPSALGWDLWHELDEKYGLGLVTAALTQAMEGGYIERQPVGPLAHLMLGALNEAGLMLARAEDVEAAREQFGAGALRLLEGLKQR